MKKPGWRKYPHESRMDGFFFFDGFLNLKQYLPMLELIACERTGNRRREEKKNEPHSRRLTSSTSRSGAHRGRRTDAPMAARTPRGILKKTNDSDARPHLTWDEETIAEHDKERGTRMKIDEPDTPFARYDPHTDPDALIMGASPPSPPAELQPVRSTSLDDHLGALAEKLARAATDAEKPAAMLFVEEEERDEETSRAFASKRQQHYNMAGLLGRKFADEDDMEEEDGS